jgi:hypothetical protein
MVFQRLLAASLAVSAAFATSAQPSRIRAKVHPSIPAFEFRAHTVPGDAENSSDIDRIEVWQAGWRIQKILFEEQDQPLVFGPAPNVSIKDVDCDGYKDLLVRQATGSHGDSWYYLYRFDRGRMRFIEYPSFISLPLSKVDCGRNRLFTYVNSGGAGCRYESGEYRWQKGKLVPVRIESQDDPGDGLTVIRTIRTWRNGKETVAKRNITGDDCHVE